MPPFRSISPVRFFRDVVKLYFSHRISQTSAALAYFLILSLFPLLLCVNAALGRLELDTTAFFQVLSPLLPQASLSVLDNYLRYLDLNQSPPLLLAGIFTLLLTVSAAFRLLFSALAKLYDRRSFSGLRQLAASIVCAALGLVTVYLSIAVVLTGDWFFAALERLVPALPDLRSLYLWRYLLLFAVVLLFVLLVYLMAAPRAGGPRPPVFRGAVLSAAAIVIASALFSRFIGFSSRYSLVYGSLASVTILLAWLYLIGNLLFLGCVCNCAWYRRRLPPDPAP